MTIAARAGGGNPTTTLACERLSRRPRAATCPATTSRRPSSAAPARSRRHLRGITYEGLRHRRAAVMLTGTTDNKNRTTSEIRKSFPVTAEHGESGAWLELLRKGVAHREKSAFADEEKLIGIALDQGRRTSIRQPGPFRDSEPLPGTWRKVKATCPGRDRRRSAEPP